MGTEWGLGKRLGWEEGGEIVAGMENKWVHKLIKNKFKNSQGNIHQYRPAKSMHNFIIHYASEK